MRDFSGSLARVAELADAYGSGPYGATRGGSSPLASTNSLSLSPAVNSEGSDESNIISFEETSRLRLEMFRFAPQQWKERDCDKNRLLCDEIR